VNKETNDAINPKFRFIERSIVHDDVPVPEASFRVGCNCDDDKQCMYGGCQCVGEMVHDEDDDEDIKQTSGRRRRRLAYHTRAAKAELLRSEFLVNRDPIYECHEGCSCSMDCPNRVVQRGRTVPLQIFRTLDRGWGVRCPLPIRKGQFVDCYVGEVITSEEANRRREIATMAKKKEVYMFALDKYSDPDSLDPLLRAEPMEVDGEFMSGPTRFINHSCDPNLAIFARVGDLADRHIHDLAFFAIKDIPQNEELTFDYTNKGHGLEEDQHDPSKTKDMTKCLCGSANCRGFIW